MKLLNENNTLNDGRIVSLFYSNCINDCRASILMLRTLAELTENGFNLDYGIPIFNRAEVIWAEVDNIPVGGICYYKQDNYIPLNWILLSFTDPGWRGLGINKICHEELEILSRAAGLKQITSFVSVKNTSRIRSCEKVGMTGDFYRMSKKLD